MDATMPAKNGVEVTLPDGEIVWLVCLNSLHREEADRKARRYAQGECHPFLPGGVDHVQMASQFKAMAVEDHAQYLAGGEYWKIREEAEAKHPDPIEPEQGELSAEAFALTFQKWEKACTTAAEKRKQWEERRFEEEQKKAAALTPKVRLERCKTLFIMREFLSVLSVRLQLETLLRAVRQAESHTTRYFSCVEEVADAPDVVRELLWEHYQELDLSPKAVPTSPSS